MVCHVGDGFRKSCLVWVVIAGLCFQGCERQEPVGESAASDSYAAGEAAMELNAGLHAAGTRYTNDLDRLGRLTDRINRACRTKHVVVLGGPDSAASNGPVSVDYALFDKLTDDGAAVLIAEAVVSRSKSLPLAQTLEDAPRLMLEVDESVGRYVGKAGFGPTGFAEWLTAKSAWGAGLQQNNLPESTRIAAFMRGYSAERVGSRGE